MSLPSSSRLSASPPRGGVAASLPVVSPLSHAAASGAGTDFSPPARSQSRSGGAPRRSSSEERPAAAAATTASAPSSSSPHYAHPPAHCAFVLVAEFDIDKGSTLSHQYPAPIGQDEYMLAELMLPDGAHARAEDWTTFFLKHPPTARVAEAQEEVAAQSKGGGAGGSAPSITHVLNLVRTKHDNSVRRGALVKAMAIGTTHPFIHVFKPVLLLALDDFFTTGGTAPLQRLYEALNSMDLSGMPQLSRDEKFILRASEQRDLFRERFGSGGLERQRSRNGSDDISASMHKSLRPRPSSNSIAVSLGDDPPERMGASSSASHNDERASSPPPASMPQPLRRPSGASMRASSPALSERRPPLLATALGVDGTRQRRPSAGASSLLSGYGVQQGSMQDTHWYETSVVYQGKMVRLRIPVATFAEEVGEYSLVALHSSFGNSTPVGPQHAHLHSNGAWTPSLILLFNAIMTSKRVIFLGHGQPAHTVASHVLAACALASGGGAVFRGLIRRAFPYCNLGMMDELERTPGYIAGVTNPRFEELHAWDVLFNIETGKVSVAKDIEAPPPLRPNTRPSAASRHGTFSSGSIASMSGSAGIGHEAAETGEFGTLGGAAPSIKSGRERTGGNAQVIEARQDALDVLFIEDVLGAVQARYGERYLLARWVDYAQGFARTAARHEEHFYGHTTLAAPSQPFLNGQLGSGVVFGDRETELRETQANAHRAEGWLATESYRLYRDDEAQRERQRAAGGQTYDLQHQVNRLKRARQINTGEAELLFSTLASSIRSAEQVTELLALHPAHSGGLSSLSVGLLHPSSTVRHATLELLLQLSSFALGQKFIQQLNVFHRLTFARLLSERGDAAILCAPPTAGTSHAPPQFARRPSGGTMRDGLPSSAGSLPFSANSSASHAYLAQPSSAIDSRAPSPSALSYTAAT